MNWIAGIAVTLAMSGLVAGTVWATEYGNGLVTARENALCTTVEGWAVTSTLTDLRLLERLMTTGDVDAMVKLYTDKRIILTKADAPVFVVRRDEIRVEVRPKGEVVTAWMLVYGLNCPEGTAEQGTQTK